MSRLSKYLREQAIRQLVRAIVDYLESRTDITGEQKKALAVKALKALHELADFTSQFDTALEKILEEAIEWAVTELHLELADIEGHLPWDEEPVILVPNTDFTIYHQWTAGALPSEEELLQMGFVAGDITYHNAEGWIVFSQGSKHVVSRDLEASRKVIGE